MPAVGALVRCTDGSWNAATAELPARPSFPAWRHARRAPAVQHAARWSDDLDVLGMRCGGVRAGADRRLPDSRGCFSSALVPHPSTPTSSAQDRSTT
jgi:hypothetical protein